MTTVDLQRPEHPDLLFIGGTGRSGTHVLSQLLSHHSHWARVPIEARFHVNPQGFPDLLAVALGRGDISLWVSTMQAEAASAGG